MDINTGKIYPTLEHALKDGVDKKDLVQGTRETLIELRRRLNLNNKYQPHQGSREQARRIKQLTNERSE